MSISGEELRLLLKALAFSAHKHRDQRRKDVEASPYINHPIAVANLLCNEGGVEDIAVICAALLHDTLEDTDTTVEELRAEFGDTIARIVEELTDPPNLGSDERKQRQVQRVGTLSRAAQLVKLADKVANLRDIVQRPPHDWPVERRQKYFSWAKPVADQVRGLNPGLDAAFDAAYARGPV